MGKVELKGTCPTPPSSLGALRRSLRDATAVRYDGLTFVACLFVASLDTACVVGDKRACYLMGALFVFLFGRAKRNEHELLNRMRGNALLFFNIWCKHREVEKNTTFEIEQKSRISAGSSG